MIDDLLDFTRSRLGSGVAIERLDTDLAHVAREAVEEFEVAHPGRTFALQAVPRREQRAASSEQRR